MTTRRRRVEPLQQPPAHVVDVPGSKSITNRALLIAALAEGDSHLTGVLLAEDTAAMTDCVRSLGAGVDVDAPSRTILVGGVAGRVAPGPRSLFARQSGTTGRFIAAAVLAGRGRYELDGDAQLRARPMADLVDALVGLGAEVDATEGRLPMAVEVGEAVVGGTVALAAGRTSQFASALLMVGPLLSDGLELRLEGGVVSRPYLDMTVGIMKDFGASVELVDGVYCVHPGGYHGRRYSIEPDASAASYFFGAAAVTGGSVTVRGLHRQSIQGDIGFVDVLQSMGAQVESSDVGLTVQGGSLRGVDVDLRDLSDTAPTLAVVAATASGSTTIRGIGFVRGKESDRIAVPIAGLAAVGISAEQTADGLVVHGGTHHEGVVDSHDDHRIAMAFSLLGLRGPAVEISDPDCVSKTFPAYFDVLDRLRSRPDHTDSNDGYREDEGLRESDITVIAIDGPAGSGKSTVARAVADRLGLEYLDTGAMYRAVTFAVIRHGIDPADVEDVAAMACELDLSVGSDGVHVDGVDATTEIRGPEVTRAVSVVAANPGVRKELRSRQREWAHRRGGGVLEGRDIGTVVFPDARLKVYLTASPEVRAARRAKEVSDLDYETVAADIARRDAYDQGRADSPLTEADDAVLIDTTGLTVDQVVDAVEAALR
ncbi:MAG: 3-phosphoshikimate 1-carboxyvinyltransferase [Acidimicrobiia bacterium]|nr:3-phosphoshikimate 1-carboxyvinyltransferase [Acidimicrobiia bacterium]